MGSTPRRRNDGATAAAAGEATEHDEAATSGPHPARRWRVGCTVAATHGGRDWGAARNAADSGGVPPHIEGEKDTYVLVYSISEAVNHVCALYICTLGITRA